jgi:hypothetical protein
MEFMKRPCLPRHGFIYQALFVFGQFVEDGLFFGYKAVDVGALISNFLITPSATEIVLSMG